MDKKSIRAYIDETHIALLESNSTPYRFKKKLIGVLACFLCVLLIVNAHPLYGMTKAFFYNVFYGIVINEDEMDAYGILENPIIKDNYTIQAFYRYKDTVYYRIKHKSSIELNQVDLICCGEVQIENGKNTTSKRIEGEHAIQQTADNKTDTYTTLEGYYRNVKNSKDFTLSINDERITIDLVKPKPISNIITYKEDHYNLHMIPLSKDYKNFALIMDGYKKYDHVDYELRDIYLVDSKNQEHLAIPKGSLLNEYELLEPTQEEIVGIRGGILSKSFPKPFADGITIHLPNPKNKGTLSLDKVVEIEGLPTINILEISNDLRGIPDDYMEMTNASKGRKGYKITYFIENNGHFSLSAPWSNDSGGYPVGDNRVTIIYTKDDLLMPNDDTLTFNMYSMHSNEHLAFNFDLP